MKVCFTVIMPCYNSAQWVETAINSLIGQTSPDWELIIINDGSTDKTLDIVNQYAAKDHRIRVYTKPNGGYVSAVNYGLEKVTGDYFLLMGSDDQIAPSLFSEIEESLTGELPDMIGFRAVKVSDGKILGIDDESRFSTFSEKYNSTIKEYESLYPEQSRIFFVRDTAKCFKTTILGDLRYFGKYGFDADGIFSTLFAHKCKSFMSIPMDGYLWTIREDSLSAKTTPQIDADRLDNWIQYYQTIATWDENTIANHAKSYCYLLHSLGCKLAAEVNKLDVYTIRLINTARKCYVAAAQRFELPNAFSENPIKTFVFKRLPTLWLYLYRLKARRK